MLSAALEEALRKERLGHCLLFIGAAGSGQKEAVLALAERLFGASEDIRRGSHPDFTVLAAEEGDTMIKIDAVKELIARASLRPLRAKAKIFVIEEAHLMNDVAQNALLKTLEEPQGSTYFILETSLPQGLLETIRSRSQKFYFSPKAGAAALKPELHKLYGEALTFLLGKSTLWPDFSKEERADIMEVLDALAAMFRDVLMIRVGAADLISSEDDLLRKKECSKSLSEEQLEGMLEFLGEAKEKIKSSLNVKIVMNSLWDKAGAAHAR